MCGKGPSLPMQHRWFPLVSALLALLAPGLQASELDPELTVAIRTNASRVRLGGTHGFHLRDLVRRQDVMSRRDAAPLDLEACAEGICLQGYGTHSRMLMTAPAGGMLSVDGKRYRGRLRIEEDKFGRITVVNVIRMEEYLKGVIAAEMLVSAHPEALKAQAVVARTFALKHRNRFLKDRGYGLTADTESQVYRGFEGEDPRTNRAVLETAGSVLHIGNQLVESFYHQACGGRTQDNEDVWGGRALSHLRGVDCSYCAAQADSQRSRGFFWKHSLDRTALRAKLLVHGYRVGDILHVNQVLDRSGRAQRFHISHSEGELDLSTSKLRNVLGTSVLNSTFYRLAESQASQAVAGGPPPNDPLAEASIRTIIQGYLSMSGQRGPVAFEGAGFGHGVGLCQWGARWLAEHGRSHEDILTYYYAGVEVGVLPGLLPGD